MKCCLVQVWSEGVYSYALGSLTIQKSCQCLTALALQMQLAYKIIGVRLMEWWVANLPPICNLKTLLWQIWTSNLHIPTSSLSHQQFLQLQASEGQPKNIKRKLKKSTKLQVDNIIFKNYAHANTFWCWLATIFQVICHKWGWVFHQGFQTRENWWKHEAEGQALLLFSSVWKHWRNKKPKFTKWLLKRA